MISELTNEELIAKAEELKINLPAKFNRKNTIKEIEKFLKDNDIKEEEGLPPEETEEESEEEDRIEPTPVKPVSGAGITEDRVKAGSKAEIMKNKLSKQVKVSILVPLGQGEKPGTTLPVTLNGYRLNILKGVYVEVPKQIADVVKDSQKQTMNALFGNEKNLDKNGDLPEALQGR